MQPNVNNPAGIEAPEQVRPGCLIQRSSAPDVEAARIERAGGSGGASAALLREVAG